MLKSGLDALAANDVAGARAVREALPANSLDRHILAWAIALMAATRCRAATLPTPQRCC
jgi:soluble lytic murein transglycosylase